MAENDNDPSDQNSGYASGFTWKHAAYLFVALFLFWAVYNFSGLDEDYNRELSEKLDWEKVKSPISGQCYEVAKEDLTLEGRPYSRTFGLAPIDC